MGKNWAIAIGINQYSYLQSLQFAKTDAEAMDRWLLDEGGFDRVFLFTDDSPPILAQPPIPTSPTFGHLYTFFDVQFDNQLLTSGDNLWFFFSGHGNRGVDGDYLMLSDSNPRQLERTALSVSYITERLRNWRAGNVVMFIDACRNEVEKSRGEAIAMEDYQGIIAFYSCRAKEKSLEIKDIKQGAFTHVLLKVLAETKQQNCCLTVAELENCLMGEVPKLNPNQHPLARVEPTYKRDFVLFGEAGQNDVESLKNLAYRKCFEGKNEEAKELLIHANLVAKGGDFEVIEALGRLHGSSPISMPSPQPKLSPKPSQKQESKPIEIPEIKEAKPEIELKSEKGVDYTKLRDFLAAGQWKEADEETLRVMCKAADRTKEGWLRTEDVDRFPCEDLRTIDRLWVHYSDGKFGFSVQTKIYQELGGTREYKQGVWINFCDRVGWRIGEEWLDYTDLTFDLINAVYAHLPVVKVEWGVRGGGCASSLAQRLITCNINHQLPVTKISQKNQIEPIKIPEIKEVKPEIELKSEKGIDYRKLRDFLAAGQWKEADEETWRVMCKAADRTTEGWLKTEDIDRFPCEDLRTIDRLWVCYSEGKFSFSVQKKIYQELGGTREYNREVWGKFGDRVGWRKKGKWLDYSDLTFDLKNASHAHLPVFAGSRPPVSDRGFVVAGSRWNSLLSHRDL